jgi:hypothetical protein
MYRKVVFAAFFGLLAFSALVNGAELKTISVITFNCQEVTSISGMKIVVNQCGIETELDIEAEEEEFPLAYVCWFDLKLGVNRNQPETLRSEAIETTDFRSWARFTTETPQVRITTIEKFTDFKAANDQVMWAQIVGVNCVQPEDLEEQNTEQGEVPNGS